MLNISKTKKKYDCVTENEILYDAVSQADDDDEKSCQSPLESGEQLCKDQQARSCRNRKKQKNKQKSTFLDLLHDSKCVFCGEGGVKRLQCC